MLATGCSTFVRVTYDLFHHSLIRPDAMVAATVLSMELRGALTDHVTCQSLLTGAGVSTGNCPIIGEQERGKEDDEQQKSAALCEPRAKALNKPDPRARRRMLVPHAISHMLTVGSSDMQRQATALRGRKVFSLPDPSVWQRRSKIIFRFSIGEHLLPQPRYCDSRANRAKPSTKLSASRWLSSSLCASGTISSTVTVASTPAMKTRAPIWMFSLRLRSTK